MAAVTPTVKLLRHTPQADALIAAAGKLCYAADTEALLAQDADDAERFIARVVGLGHLSIIEHVSFTFYVEGVSRAMTHQLVRHRLASYSQRSQRYVVHENFDYVTPPQLAGKTVVVEGRSVDAVAFYEDTMRLIAERYRLLNDALGRTGESSNEDARYVLPNACETKIIVTMNARELRHFFAERLCQRAQWEIRAVAQRMFALVKPVCPAVLEKAGPKCVVLGRCPEGQRSCGRREEMRRQYG